MKRHLIILLIPLLLLCACNAKEQPAIATPTTEPAPQATAVPAATEPQITEPEHTEPEITEPVTTESETTEPEPQPEHSPLYIPGASADDVIRFFSEVCLDAEFVHSGDATLLQRWETPICYTVEGNPTEDDLSVLADFTAWLNSIEGFPGIREWQGDDLVNLRIHFCTADALVSIMGDTFTGLDGAVTFWYDGSNTIYDATICIRTDLDQHLRNSVIQEEIYNGLGPIQDTDLRPDSLIYSGFSEPQSPTAMDRLILQLLYHPELSCGMTGEECAEVIRQLYY